MKWANRRDLLLQRILELAQFTPPLGHLDPFNGDGAAVPTNLRTLDRVEVANKHKWLTVVHAPLTVEAGERCGGLATCARTARRHSERGTDASTLCRRASWPK